MTRIVGQAPAELSCARCKEIKPSADFRVTVGRGKSRYDSYCRDCNNAYARDFRAKDVASYRAKANAYYQANAEKKKELARQWRAGPGSGRHKSHVLKKMYGISLEEYEALLDSQDGVCAICQEPPSGKNRFLSVDHDHDTGRIRGLLCTRCNVGLGALHDSAEILRTALMYLEGSVMP